MLPEKLSFTAVGTMFKFLVFWALVGCKHQLVLCYHTKCYKVSTYRNPCQKSTPPSGGMLLAVEQNDASAFFCGRAVVPPIRGKTELTRYLDHNSMKNWVMVADNCGVNAFVVR